MSKYRFKTKQEFIREGLWDDEYDAPKGWNIRGYMNEFLGQDINECHNSLCDNNKVIYNHGWLFRPWSYVLKETNANDFEYFGDKLMEVSSNNEYWFPRVVFGKKGGCYLAWNDAKTLEEAKNAYGMTVWRDARPFKTKLTLKQVAEKFGLKEHEIEIIES